jgi:hypothetical protein
MVPLRPAPLSVLPRNDSEPSLNVMLDDGSHVPDCAASVTERLPRKLNWDDVKVKEVDPKAPSPHKVEKMDEHDGDVWSTAAGLEGPAEPPLGAVADADPSPPFRFSAFLAFDVTDTDAGPETTTSLESAGT